MNKGNIEAALVEKLQHYCGEMELELGAEQYQKLIEYLLLFEKWNKAYNLSAIRNIDEMLLKHLVDSLSIIKLFQEDSGKRYMDVGTGGGLPGIPLAICFPERQFCLIDSAGKKIRFLFQVKQALSLDNVELSNARVEHYAGETNFDGILSRAFASAEDFSDLCAPLLADHGKLWAMKGVFPADELSALKKHYIVLDHFPLNVPGLDAQRCLVLIGKHKDSERASAT